jgi:uracil-DNA glycosylase
MDTVTEPEPLFDLEPALAAGPDFAELARLPFDELMAPDWAAALAGVEAELRSVLEFLAAEEAAGSPGAAVAVENPPRVPAAR